MKRSEMLDEITERLRLETITEDTLPDDIAKIVLSVVETMGMQPPGHTYWNRGKNGGIMPSAKNGEQIHTWENE